MKKISYLFILCLYFSSLSLNVSALTVEDSEQVFLKKYSGQTKEFVSKYLGKPTKVDLAVKPQNADEILKEQKVEIAKVEKKEMIEMWYYDAKISYAKDKFFNQAELTFVNNKCVNITLANKKESKKWQKY